MVKIKFIRQGANSLIGGFSAGDFARVSESFAAHLVDDAQVAVYAEQQTVSAPETTKPKRSRKAKD